MVRKKLAKWIFYVEVLLPVILTHLIFVLNLKIILYVKNLHFSGSNFKILFLLNFTCQNNDEVVIEFWKRLVLISCENFKKMIKRVAPK